MDISQNELSLREVQLVELSILRRLVHYFEKHDIHYILCGGTLLGAVRHDGFIPWDDDVDILVPRDDYERLKQLYRSGEVQMEGIKLRLPGDTGSPHPFIKAIDPNYIAIEEKRGEKYRAYAWVDVFPMDHFPDDEKQHKYYLRRIDSLVKVLSANTITNEYMKSRGYYSNPVKFAKLVGAKIVFLLYGGSSKLARKIDQIAHDMDTDYKSSNHVGDGAWPNGMKDYFLLSYVEPVMKHQFEDAEFNIPVNYDSYLTQFYGEYMKIPPENEREDHHISVFRIAE